MSIELGGFAEDETVIDGDFNAFNYCLAYDYLCAFENEDFDALGEVNNDLIDTITDWLNYDGEIGKNNIDKIAKLQNVANQTLWDMFFFENFLNRISKSKHNKKFVFKGGFLLGSIFGVKQRTTLDIDLKYIGVTLENQILLNMQHYHQIVP